MGTSLIRVNDEHHKMALRLSAARGISMTTLIGGLIEKASVGVNAIDVIAGVAVMERLYTLPADHPTMNGALEPAICHKTMELDNIDKWLSEDESLTKSQKKVWGKTTHLGLKALSFISGQKNKDSFLFRKSIYPLLRELKEGEVVLKKTGDDAFYPDNELAVLLLEIISRNSHSGNARLCFMGSDIYLLREYGWNINIRQP